jgi:NAD(P)-dependent dehydrogenase (short-subunit alcohol dehydrogenase family)
MLDVRSESDMQEMAKRVLDEFGRIDILVAAAGIGGSLASAKRLPYAVVQMPLKEWDEVIDTNLKGIFLSNRAVLGAMMKQRKGNIINVSSSRGATGGQPFAAAYSASKYGVVGISETLAEEVQPFNIRVQVVMPDATDTPLLHGRKNLASRGIMKPSTVANFIVRMLTLPDEAYLVNPIITL